MVIRKKQKSYIQWGVLEFASRHGIREYYESF